MKIYEKKWEQWVPATLDEAWGFFSRPENLNRITPEDMDFEILSDISGMQMYPGMIVRYKVRPVFNIPMNWVTEITHVQDRKYFIDEQRFGPYALWHHQHHFQEKDGGVLMTDILHYAIPFGPLGRIANAVLVDNRVEDIFRFREKVISDIFPG